ncbi:MAG: glycosyltransferase [Caldilinea sp. CFX5]|nr:glycosyltransferase [Caldilinea sp. CFX5]
MRRTIEILGVRVDCVDFAETLDQIAQWIEEGDAILPDQPTHRSKIQNLQSKIRQICTVNPEFIMMAQRDAHFAAVLRQADLCVPDGVGVLWAARRQGVVLQERVTGSDGIYRICERAAQCGWRVFLLGAAEGVAAQAAQRLVALYPQLQVVGVYSGSPAPADWPTIAERLTAAHPHILFVAFGHPRQDLWIAQHRHELPALVALGVGGAFDFVAGVMLRAPHWMQRWGVEWLYRLLQEPWRWRRMAVLPLFALRILWRGKN